MAVFSRRGRKPKDESDRLNAQVWYYAVRAREGLSDQALSEKFATDQQGQKRKGADHIRIFGRIRRQGAMPSKQHPKRNYNLVLRIDEDPVYAGTAKIMGSPFWKLIRKAEIDLEDIRSIVVQCIKILGVACEPGDVFDDGSDYLEEKFKDDPNMPLADYLALVKQGDHYYDEALGNALMPLPVSLDYIALVGALGLEAARANNIQIASDHMNSFSNLLVQYCLQPWLAPVGKQLLNLATSRMQSVLAQDMLKGMPRYTEMVQREVPGANMNSHVMALLRRHERLLWRR